MKKKSGNFEIIEEKGIEHDYLKIRATSGIWEMRFRDDNEMFMRMKQIMAEPGLEVHLRACIQMSYIVCNTVPDLQFLDELNNAYVGMIKRYENPPFSDEEDSKILDEMRRTYRQN